MFSIGIRASLIPLVTVLVASGAPAAAESGFLLVAVEKDAVYFSLADDDLESISVRILDSAYVEVLSTGPLSGSEFTWDLRDAELDGVEDGIFVYEAILRTLEGEFKDREMGRFVAAPQSREPGRLVEQFRLTTGVPDVQVDQAVLVFFTEPGDFTIGGSLGVGTDAPQRAVHLQGPNALFRMDRDRNTSAFLLTRTARNDLSDIWKSFVIGVNADGPEDGEFIINDLGSAVSGGGTRRLTIRNNGDVNIEGRLCIANDCRESWPDVGGGGASTVARLQPVVTVQEISGDVALAYLEYRNIAFIDAACNSSSGTFTVMAQAHVHVEHADGDDHVELCIIDSPTAADCAANDAASYGTWRVKAVDSFPGRQIFEQTISFQYVQRVTGCAGTKRFYLDGIVQETSGYPASILHGPGDTAQDTKIVATFFPD